MEIPREEIFSVTEATRLVKNVIAFNLPTMWVEGEIANFTAHSSGHIYFSLKDDSSSLRCAFFRQYNAKMIKKPKNGDKVICQGKVDVFEKSGSYQLLVKQLLEAGMGELQLKFIALKNKLEAEGLFKREHKKRIPLFPEKIGIITSATGAAFQDIKNILSRRYPCEVYLYPAVVQGEAAPSELIAGLQYFNAEFPVDLIIIGRGGGSQEDLFCFNDEMLARTIFSSDIPIISAVGHEIDFTIADFVADLRAPTPSAAAELAVPDKKELRDRIKSMENHITAKIEKTLLSHRNLIINSRNTMQNYHPSYKLHQIQQYLDELSYNFREKSAIFSQKRQRYETLSNRFIHTMEMTSKISLQNNRNQLTSLLTALDNAAQSRVLKTKNYLENTNTRLQKYSPKAALKRGYAIIEQEKRIVSSVHNINKNEKLKINLKDGKIDCIVEKIVPDENS